MKKWMNPFESQEKTYLQLASDNCKAIGEYNEKILSVLTRLGGMLMLLPVLLVPFRTPKTVAVPVYLLAASLYFVIFLLFRLPVMKKYTLWGLYIGFSAFFLSAVYLSVIHSPHMRATVLLCAFCIVPISFIDRPVYINLFVTFWFVLHTLFAFYLKPQHALSDTINSLGFAILGCVLGNIMVWVRLESYEARRLLTIEKETDVLTGLFNRRKLFETLAVLETEDAKKPSGVLMVDIDHYKNFNDIYGHTVGDICLSRVGETMMKFMQNFRLHFYRYGGEEFVAMAYGYNEQELLAIAESLRIAVQSMDIDGCQITVSIGVAYCGDEAILNYEKVIDRADQAAYTAKRTGRNRVCRAEGQA
ncbi:MAG: GGDEF domain-containing protein [Lacrimispora sp.]|uniref:GGDEF domain-containing protein n=1 Tax=Lacrimispora sp. TaxID=2719234 RepID=UPI0039E6215C